MDHPVQFLTEANRVKVKNWYAQSSKPDTYDYFIYTLETKLLLNLVFFTSFRNKRNTELELLFLVEQIGQRVP